MLRIKSFKDIMEKNPKVTHTKGLGNVIASAFNFIFHVDLTNPVVIFKCDQKYIKERLFLFSDEDQGSVAKKPVNRVKNSFIDMMQDVEPLFESDKKKLKKRERDEEEKAREGEESDVSQEVRDYTDTLTTWVNSSDLIVSRSFFPSIRSLFNKGWRIAQLVAQKDRLGLD